MAENILNKFRKNLPEIYNFAILSECEEHFFDHIRNYAQRIIESNNNSIQKDAANLILSFLQYESKFIQELSKGDKIYLETLSLLWNFLIGNTLSGAKSDLFEDLYHIFLFTKDDYKLPDYSLNKLNKHMKRWPSGLDRDIRERRAANKERIILQLVKKIEKRVHTTSRFHFEEGLSHKERVIQVNEWWSDFRFHLVMAIKSPSELNTFLGESLSTKSMRILNRAKNKKIPFFITPYYLSLLNTDENGFDDLSIRSYIIYSESLVETYGNIKAWEREDTLVEGEPNAAGWLLPKGHNIHRRYPEVAIMIPDTRGRSCGGLCSSCQRMYDFQSERLNFDMDALKPLESWERKLSKLMEYFEYDSQIRDILITGGDALMSKNRVLENILNAVLKMAQKKRDSNSKRAQDEKYYNIQRVRLGTRLLAYLPMRVNSELISILREFKRKGVEAGIEQFVIQTHIQSPLEITPQARETIKALISAGWIITNQLVFTAAVSRRGHTAKLRQLLNSLGVVSYYTFTVKGFEENMEMYAPNSRSMQEQKEEKLFGKIPDHKQVELNTIFSKGDNLTSELNKFMKENSLPFLPTDRNVLNLPAIGKSMTFKLVGISKEGKRVLLFDHDRTRQHSPVIDKMGEVFIIENRSISSYLRELEAMGEKIKDYDSIWSYTWGETEHLFPLFEYPNPNYTPTTLITNFREKE
ncbi:MAG TPA: KamA family protein [Rikenellaceae bacterium]|nr:MAG: KamA family protein [Bacteroidetes bacterium GWE2_40_15]HBZ25964.1 KamA family protein [Rikenellaceae bacterium]